MENIDFSIYAFDETDIPKDKAVEALADNPLGNTNGTHIPNTILHNNPYDIYNIFFTINPADFYWLELREKIKAQHMGGINAGDLELCCKVQFRSSIKSHFKKLFRYLRTKYQCDPVIYIYFEKTNRLHCHGLIYHIPDTYWQYQPILDNLSKRLHKIYGKPRLRSDIAAKFQWVDIGFTGSYLRKDVLKNRDDSNMRPIRIRDN